MSKLRTYRGWMVVAAALIALVAVAGCSAGGQQGGYPTKGIEYLCQSTAGGSSDRFVRAIADMLAQEKIITVPLTVTNMPGGSGAVAANHLKGKAKDPYIIMNTAGGFVASPLKDPKVPGYKDFTPIAGFALDANVAILPAKSKYKDLKELVAASKAEPGKLVWTGTSVGTQDQLSLLMIEDMSGAKFTYLPFDGSNEVIAAVLGGHADVGWVDAGVAKAQAAAGTVRLIGVQTPDRVKAMPDLPTFKEQGYDVNIYMQRGVVAPADIPADAKKYLSDAFGKLIQTQRWKDYADSEGLVKVGVLDQEYFKFLEQQSNLNADLLKKAGLMK